MNLKGNNMTSLVPKEIDGYSISGGDPDASVKNWATADYFPLNPESKHNIDSVNLWISKRETADEANIKANEFLYPYRFESGEVIINDKKTRYGFQSDFGNNKNYSNLIFVWTVNNLVYNLHLYSNPDVVPQKDYILKEGQKVLKNIINYK